MNKQTLVQLEMSDMEDVNGGTGALCRSVIAAKRRASAAADAVTPATRIVV